MGFWDVIGWPFTAEKEALGGLTDVYTSYDALTAPQKKARAQRFLIGEALVLGAGAIPAVYAYSLRRKRKLTKGEERLGVSLENASTVISGPLMTALAAPAIATVLAYITVQKMEDAGIVSSSLGNDVQGILTVAAAGPAIAGIGQIAQSAFLKGK